MNLTAKLEMQENYGENWENCKTNFFVLVFSLNPVQYLRVSGLKQTGRKLIIELGWSWDPSIGEYEIPCNL